MENGEDEPDLGKDPSDDHSPPGSEIPSADKQKSSAVASASSSGSSSAAGGQMKYMRSKIDEMRTKASGAYVYCTCILSICACEAVMRGKLCVYVCMYVCVHVV